MYAFKSYIDGDAYQCSASALHSRINYKSISLSSYLYIVCENSEYINKSRKVHSSFFQHGLKRHFSVYKYKHFTEINRVRCSEFGPPTCRYHLVDRWLRIEHISADSFAATRSYFLHQFSLLIPVNAHIELRPVLTSAEPSGRFAARRENGWRTVRRSSCGRSVSHAPVVPRRDCVIGSAVEVELGVVCIKLG